MKKKNNKEEIKPAELRITRKSIKRSPTGTVLDEETVEIAGSDHRIVLSTFGMMSGVTKEES